MAVLFEGFPRVLARSALRPGRWFAAPAGRGPTIGFMTEVGEGEDALVLTFRPSKLDQIDFAPARMRELPGTLASVEDDLVFAPGEAADRPRMIAPVKRPFLSGSLLRLRNGDLGVGFAERSGGELMLVSLSSGALCEGFELVFDRWSLSLRRAGATLLLGQFRPPS